MPPRTGPNGAIVKPSAYTKSQRNARSTASKVIDLTPDEASGKSSGEESGEENESEDASKRHEAGPVGRRGSQIPSAGTQVRTLGAGRATIGGPNTKDHQRVARRGQESILEDSFIVTSLHHRPWGAGDDTVTVGVFSTEREAEVAAEKDFERCASQSDGWEHEWRHRSGDSMKQLYGYCEDGEDDSETYTASIKWVQQKRPVAVQPSVPSAARPKPKAVKPRHVYVVKEEQRTNVEEDDPQDFDDLGDPQAIYIHGIYVNLDAANAFAREVCDTIVEVPHGEVATVTETLENSMVTILVAYRERMKTYSISVEQRSLK